MSYRTWLPIVDTLAIASSVLLMAILACLCLRWLWHALRYLCWLLRPDKPLAPFVSPDSPHPPSLPFPSLVSLSDAPIFFWSPTPDIAIPVLTDDAHRNWQPTLDTYKALVAFALQERGGLLAVPPAYVPALTRWFAEAYEAGHLSPNREPALREGGPTWLLVQAYPKL